MGGIALADMLESEGCIVNTLLLSRNILGPEAGERVAKAMLSNSLVTALDLGHNAIGAEAGIVMASVIKRSTSLTSLNLEHNELGPRGGVPLFRALLVNVGPTALDLASNAVGPKCTPLLSAVLARDHGTGSILRHADLSSNRLGRHAGVAFAQALLKNRTLEVLSLPDNRFDAEVGFALVKAVARNKIISTLHVREIEIGREAFSDLQKRMRKRVSRTREGNVL